MTGFSSEAQEPAASDGSEALGQSEDYTAPASGSLQKDQRSPLWGSTFRGSLGWFRDNLGKREATLVRLFLLTGSPGGVMSMKNGIN